MMLRQRKGCYDQKDLEGVLPVLDRCLYDGGDGGVVHIQSLAAHGADTGRMPLLSAQLFDFLFLPCYAAVKGVICENLLVKLFRQLCRVKILGVSHLTKELFAPAGKFYPICFETLSKPYI